MTRRFHYRALILVAIATGVVLIVVGLTHYRFGRDRRATDNRALAGETKAAADEHRDDRRVVTGDTNAVSDDFAMRAAIAELERRQALAPAPSPTVPGRLSDDEDEDLAQSSDEDLVATLPQTRAGGGDKTASVRPVLQTATAQKFVLGETTIEQTARGPVATIQFRAVTTEPVGPVTVVAFLPPGSDARIIDFAPAGSAAYSEADTRRSENGWFVAFQGTAQGTTDLSFRLSVSQPVTATIKGNLGVEPFEINF
jgi:hypothetical protein